MKRYINYLKMRYLLFAVCLLFAFHVKGQVTPNINSGNPVYPFPQFVAYEYEGGHHIENLATHNSPGVPHAEMEQRTRDAWIQMCNRLDYTGKVLNGVKYITGFPGRGYAPPYDCVESDGYALLGAASMCDKPAFDGIWLRCHDVRKIRYPRYIDGVIPDPNYQYGLKVLKDNTDAATDGDVDVALALLIAYKQWGEFMGINDSKGNPISYKQEALDIINGLVEIYDRFKDPNDCRRVFGDIGLDGYHKGGNTWNELTDWASNQNPCPEYKGPQKTFVDYAAPAYFKEFADFLSQENQPSFNITQFRRAEASDDWLYGTWVSQNPKNIPWAGYVTLSGTTVNFTTMNDGEDFRAGWRTILNYVWHGNPTYSWNPTTHQVEANKPNTFEYNAGKRLADFVTKRHLAPWSMPCEDMRGTMALKYFGVISLHEHYGVDGTDKGTFPLNKPMASCANAAVAAQDFDLMGKIFRKCVHTWDAISDKGRQYEQSIPDYMHDIFRLSAMQILGGNYPAPSNIKPTANMKVYVATDKTYAFNGDLVTYTISYRNYGSLDANNVTITDELPIEYTVISATNGGVISGNKVSWSISKVPGFKTGTGVNPTIGEVKVICKVNKGATGRLCNQAVISCSNGSGWTSNEYPNNQTAVMERNCVDVATRALEISKSASKSGVKPGDSLVFSLNFENSSTAGWLNGGRPGVTAAFAYDKARFNTKGQDFFVQYRLYHGADEAFIDYGNYRVSYYIYDPRFTAIGATPGWAVAAHTVGESGSAIFDLEKIVQGTSSQGSWNQRIIMQFGHNLATVTPYLTQYAGNTVQTHEGFTVPLRAVYQISPMPAQGRDWTVDWSYDPLALDSAKGPYFPITDDWTDPNNGGVPITKVHCESCNTSSHTIKNMLVEEWDGYTWRRVFGNSPMPGRETEDVVIIDTIPVGFTFKNFIGVNPFGVAPTITGNIIKWTIPRLQVQQKGVIKYSVIANGSCPMTDKQLINRAWISAKTESPVSSADTVKITCDSIPPDPPKTSSLYKTSDKTTYQANDNISYTLKYAQRQGTIVSGNTKINDWTDFDNNGKLTISGNTIDVTGSNNGMIYNYSHGTNGYIGGSIDVGSYANVSIIVRQSGNNYVAITLNQQWAGLEISFWNNATQIGGTQSTTCENYTKTFPFKIILKNDLLMVWVGDTTSILPTVSQNNIPIRAGYAGVLAKDGSHKVYDWYTNLDSGFGVEISDALPSNIVFVSAAGSGKSGSVLGKTYNGVNSNGRIKWDIVTGTTPMLYGDSVVLTINGKINNCSGEFTNWAYANIKGYPNDGIGAISKATCGSSCTPPTKVTLTPSTTAISCGKPVTLTAAVTAPTTGSWKYKFFKKGTSSNTALNKFGTTNTIDVTSSGDYLVRILDAAADDTSSASCYLESSAVTVTINPKPAVDTITPKDSLWMCQGGSKLLRVTDISGASYEWTPGGISTIPSSKYLATSAGTYTVKVSKDGCDSTLVLVVSEKKKPLVQVITHKDSLWMCSNSNRTLSVTKDAGFSYQWKKGSPASNITGEVTSDYIATAAGDYTVFVSNSQCDTSVTITLDEKKPLSYTITGGGDSCKGQKLPNIIITASAKPFSYLLAGATGMVKVTNLTDTIKPLQPGIFQVSKITSEFQCETLDNGSKVTVSYIDTPTVSITPIITGICSNDSINLTALSDIAGGQFTWTGTAVDAQGKLNGTKAQGTSTSFMLTQTTTAGCVGRYSKTIGVWTAPKISLAQDTVRECQGNAAPLSASASLGQTPYTWKWLNATGLTSSTIPNPSTLTSLLKNTYTFDLQLTDGNQCKATTKAVVVISEKEKPNFVLSPASVCANAAAIDLATMTTQPGGQFHINGKSIASVLLPKKYAFTSGDAQVNIHYVSGAAACADSTEQTLTIKALPTVAFPADAPKGLCENSGKYQFSAFVPSNGTLTGTGVIAGTSKFDPSVVTSKNTPIDLQYVGIDKTSNCSDTALAQITVYAKPSASLNLPTRFCWDAAAQIIDAQPSGGVFNVASVIVGNTFDPSKANQSETGETVSVSYTVTNTENCADTVTAKTKVYFTPSPKVIDAAAVAQGLTIVPPITVIGDSLQLTEKGTKIKTYADAWNGSYANQTYKAVGIYPYQATQTKNGCESKPKDVTLTISDCGLPPQVDNLQSCVNTTIKTFTPKLTGTNVTAKWYTDITMSQLIVIDNSFTPTDAQLSKGKETTFYVTMFDKTNNCQSTPVAAKYQYDTLPSVTLSLPASICAYQAVDLKAKESGVVFKIGSQIVTRFKASDYTTSPQTIDYELTNAVTKCTATGSFTIAIQARQKPIISFATKDSACANYQSLAFTSNIPNGTWLAPAAYLNNNTYLVGKVPANEPVQTIKYVVKDGDCYDTASRTFEIYRVSTMSLQIDSIGGLWCSNASKPITFTGQPSGGALYENGTSVTAGLASSFAVGKHTIDYVATENHCTDTVSNSFEVYAAPKATISMMPDEICAQTDYILPLISDGTWSGSSVTSNGLGYTLSPQGTMAQFRPLLQIKDAHGCTDTASKRVTSKKPAAPQFNDPTVVLGEKSATIKVIDSATNAGTVNWITSKTTGNTYLATGLSVAKVYPYPAKRSIVMNGESCESETVTAYVTVIDCPSLMPETIEASHLCENDATKAISVKRNAQSGSETSNYFVIYNASGKFLGSVKFTGNTADITPEKDWLPNTKSANYLYIADSSESKHCVSQKQMMSVTYHPKPTITNDLQQALCVNQGKVTQLQASIANGTWSPNGIITAQGVVNPAQVGKGTFDVTYTVTDGVSCSVTGKVWIDAVDAPLFDSTDKKRCVGADLIFSTKDNTDCWWKETGKADVEQRSMSHVTASAETGSWIVYNKSKEQNSSCKSDNVTLTYTVIANPQTPSIKPNGSCMGENINELRVLNIDASVTYDWYEEDVLVAQATPRYTPFVNKTTPYKVYASRDGCTSAAQDVTYTIYPLPNAPRITQNGPIADCYGQTTTLSADVAVYWYINNNKKTITQTKTFRPTESGIVSIRVEDGNECQSDGLKTLDYSMQPPIDPVTIVDNDFCETDTKWRPVYIGLNDDFEFEENGSLLNDTAEVFKRIHQAPGYYSFDVTKTVNSCQGTSTISIQNHQSPKPHIEGVSEMCEDDAITFRIANFDATSAYAWTSKYEELVDGHIEAVRYTFIEPSVYTIGLSETDLNGCSNTDSLKLRVIPKLQADFSWSIPSESMVQFHNTSRQRQIDNTPIVNTFEWDFGNGYELKKDSVFARKFDYGLHDVILRAGNAACGTTVFTSRMFVDISTNVAVPNVFVPESKSETINCFTPVGINLEHYEIWIYDSWGNLLWYSNKLKDGSPAECWDGTYNGQILKSDTYIWRVDARFKGDRRWVGPDGKRGDTGSQPIYGNVLLMRLK